MATAKRIVNGLGGGIGIQLGDIGDGTSLGGIDLDTCRTKAGTVEFWADEIIQKFDSYTEVSPSGTGAKIFFYYRTDDLPALREAMGGPQHGREFKRGNGKNHPPAIEIHLSNRYFTVTEDKVAGTPDKIVAVSADLLLRLLREAGPAFAGGKAKRGTDKSRSGVAFRLAVKMKAEGRSFDEWVGALQSDPECRFWYRDKGDLRQLSRTWEHAGGDPTSPDAGGLGLGDFWAYMPMHAYIFIPTRALWPASSVNARIPPIKIGADDEIKASTWLDQHRPVEQMTWAPGFPEIIKDRVLYEGGWLDWPNVRSFNQYLAPAIIPGDARRADRWLEHVRFVYSDDAEHLLCWLAHRVQKPQEKINHALVLGGSYGIGKDTMLEPVKRAIGPWNFQEASPTQVLGRFNSFLKAVILRISEARDLGEFDRFKFYDHSKSLIASPPDTLRVDEKHLREYSIPNVCGVVITTNHKSDGIYLPAEDRRHYVAWSEINKEDDRFAGSYWQQIYGYYEDGGAEAVTAYLQQLDIASFNPKAPPPKTTAFWAIVDANRAPEEPELADVLDKLGNPDAVTLARITNNAEGDFADWLKDRRNRRVMPHRLEGCGYVPVRNPDDVHDGQWRISGKRQTVYARQSLSLRARIAAAQALR